jgi:hypothetical protein
MTTSRKSLATLSRFATAALLISLSASAQAKSKYGPEATLLRDAHQYVKTQPAPDFWALIPYYAAQQTGSACSIASVSMAINAARVGMPLTSDDELATQNNVLKKTGDDDWTEAVGPKGSGRTLDQLGVLTEKAFKAYGFKNAKAEVIHVDDISAATQAKVHKALAENEKSANDFIIANFTQGAYTGDADSGHIAPVAAYDSKTKRVLILDPDRDWYEPYWVSEQTFVKGLATQDKNAGKSRGIVWIHSGK